MPSRSGVAASLLFLTIIVTASAQCPAADGALAEPYRVLRQDPAIGMPSFGQVQAPHIPPQYDLHSKSQIFQRSHLSVPGDELWWDGFDLPAIDGNVNCAIEYGGCLVIGGSIRSAGGIQVHNVARWDGTAWSDVGGGTNGEVTSLGIFQGDLVVAGPFQSADDVAASGIARWNGLSWSAFGDGLQGYYWYPGRVLALATYGNDLIAGGEFVASGGTSLFNVARWNGTSWTAMGSGFDAVVSALAVNADTLFAGGDFMTSGVDSVLALARWNGTSWEEAGGGVQRSGYRSEITALASYKSNLVVGGFFDQVGDSSISGLAVWDGVGWHRMGDFVGGITALAVKGQDSLYVAGYEDLRLWDGFGWTDYPGLSGYPFAIVPLGSDVFVGGPIRAVDDSNKPVAIGVAKYSSGEWQNPIPWKDTMHGLSVINGVSTVISLTSYRNHLVAAGQFFYSGDPPHWLPVDGIAEWDGDHWHSLPSGPIGVTIQSMLGKDDTLYVGGLFVFCDSTSPCQNTPVYRLTGSSWARLGVGDFDTRALQLYRGNLYAAGSPFGSADTTTGVYEWNGASWQAIGTMSGGYPMITCFTEWNGKLVVGGRFASVNGMNAAGLASWDGSHWEQPGSALPSYFGNDIRGLAVHEGNLIVTGALASALRWTGSAWEIMGTVQSLDAIPFSTGSELFLGGDLIGGPPDYRRFGVARWNGSDWEELGSGTNGPVFAFDVQNGMLFTGGYFSSAGGKGSYSIARWDGLAAPIAKAALLPAAPNPFRASTTFSYALPTSGSVRVSVFDLRGREVVVLQKGSQSQGMHAVTWNGRDDEGRVLPSGVYFLRADLPGGEFSRKIVHIR